MSESPRPRISATEYARRRRDLMALMEPDSIAIVPSARRCLRNRDSEYPFRQDSDFWYLCGFDEPDAVLVLVPGRRHGEFLLFCQDRDPVKEMWDGRRAGPEGACRRYGADDAFPIGDIDDILPGLIEGRERVYYAMGKHADFDRQVMTWVNSIRAREATGAHPPGEFLDLDHLLHELRLFKSAAERRVMRRAAEISAAAHCRAMLACRPGCYEYQLEAELLYEFGRNGARAPAYNSIVAGGANACILHYVSNADRLRDGDLVLIDAGCELEGYAADISRTFPVSGRFSAEQQALYELVLAAQQAAIRAVRPGHHWNRPHEEAVRVLTAGLVDLGLLDGEVDELVELEALRAYYPHKTGHWLGLDVHDVGDYKVGDQWRELEVGMVLTVEPGLYIPRDDSSVARKWRGIGIRIEDDVLVTRGGRQVLSGDVPKAIDEVEALMRERSAA
jgi:Xaa-Pro aminopeptidase